MNMPESKEITHEGLKYRVFLFLDSQTCFKCKQGGQIAAQCTTTIQQSTIPANENSSAPSPRTEETSSPTEEMSSPTEETSPPTEETPAPIEETSMQYDETTEPSQKQERKDTTQTNTRSDIDINTVVSKAKRGLSETLTSENESTSNSTTNICEA
nr:unnamed protein product [Callosobruchus analis]